MKRKISIILLVFLIAMATSSISFAGDQVDGVIYNTEKAEVLEVGEPVSLGEESFDGYIQQVKIRFLSGEKKGEEIIVENSLSDNVAYNLIVEENDKVVVTVETYEDSEGEDIYISDHYRNDYIIYLVLGFLLVVLLIGRGQGLRALVSLGLTMGSVVYILLPNILKGRNPMVWSIIISIGVTIVTILLITGLTKKSIAAIVGTSVGVLMAGLISYFIGMKIKLTGLSADDATMLMYIPQGIKFDFQQLLFAGIILGALGAVMDVGMSIASSIDEIYRANSDLTRKELFDAGMNVGRDIMGTMVNTLILAYTGTSIPLLLLFMAYDSSMMEIINLDTIATEIIRSLSGSIGLILTIPITAMISSILIKTGRGNNSEVKDKNKEADEKEVSE